MVVGYHHFRKPPYLLRSLDVIGKKNAKMSLVIPQLRRLGFHRRQGGLQRTVRIIGVLLPSINGWFRESLEVVATIKKNGGSFKEDDKPPTQKMVVRKPSYKKWWLDFQGNSQVEQMGVRHFKRISPFLN